MRKLLVLIPPCLPLLSCNFRDVVSSVFSILGILTPIAFCLRAIRVLETGGGRGVNSNNGPLSRDSQVVRAATTSSLVSVQTGFHVVQQLSVTWKRSLIVLVVLPRVSKRGNIPARVHRPAPYLHSESSRSSFVYHDRCAKHTCTGLTVGSDNVEMAIVWLMIAVFRETQKDSEAQFQ